MEASVFIISIGCESNLYVWLLVSLVGFRRCDPPFNILWLLLLITSFLFLSGALVVVSHVFTWRSFFIRRSYPTYFADQFTFPLHGSLIAGVVCISVWFGGLC